MKDSTSRDFVFCPKCREDHSLRVLKTQAEHEKSIKEVILDSRMFKSANGMADYVGVSFVTMYNWIQKYFGMTFQEFRRTYICKSSRCYLLNIGRSSYSRNDYILKKIRSKSNYCACINALEPNHIMTDCPVDVISGILRGCPSIKKISDKLFSLAPTPYHLGICKPFHFSVQVNVQMNVQPFHFSA
jgi:hypothetical protein